MDPLQKRELKRKAWMRLAAQRRRAGQLRGRVVVMSLICFAVLWGVVFAQMATGNDPVLSGKEKATKTRTVASAKREVETTDPREVEPERETSRARGDDGVEIEEVEPEVEFESEPEVEPEVEFESEPEVEPVEVEPEVELEAEPEFTEVEEEPLVTSQS